MGKFITDQILGMKWLNTLIGNLLGTLGLDVTSRIRPWRKDSQIKYIVTTDIHEKCLLLRIHRIKDWMVLSSKI